MDKHFLEFWGNFLLNAAKGQQQLENITRWLRQGIESFQGMAEIFRQAYGLREVEPASPEDQDLWKQAEESFRDSFRTYLNLLGAVPREEYAELARRYEELQEKTAEQEETIRQLRLLLEDKGLDYLAVTLKFQELMKKQGQEVEKLLGNLAKLGTEG